MKLFPFVSPHTLAFLTKKSTINFEKKLIVSKNYYLYDINSLVILSHCSNIFRDTTKMEKIDLTQQFAHRLRDAMLSAGFSSKRSTSGVCIHKLADITCYSVQICRKYLRGEAIPEPNKLIDIAYALNVAPGWLLFGDSYQTCGIAANNTLVIQKNVLRYIFKHAYTLYNVPDLNDERTDFFLALAEDISQIAADELQAKQIIDLALRSAAHFR